MTTEVKAANCIIENQLKIAQQVTDMQFEQNPGYDLKFGKTGRIKTLQDVNYHLTFLTESLLSNSTKIFNNYIAWTNSVLESRKVPKHILIENLNFLIKACKQNISIDGFELINHYISKAIENLEINEQFPVSYLNNNNPLLEIAKKYLNFLLKGKRKEAQVLILDLVNNNCEIALIFEHIFQATQYEIGLLWQKNKITVAHEHYCTASTQQIISSLYSIILNSKKNEYKMIACAISGELHELGIRMVADTFELNGWNTYYLGANMPDTDIIGALIEQKPDLLALSVTMPIHLSRATILIEKIRNEIDLNKLKIILGGYSFNVDQSLWKKMKADGMAHNCNEALILANQLIK